ncbi:hypothetical protein DJ568_11725 [Mucilaginibacter hurinus]|uniref:Uncharacterized protein n=1 Tax=Mucilaginibacter hurinus TaxID=2201324 RepID=A0A367GNQ8_9SPHI|nr:hypothetical protein [Mucilaginibacter hurinus]RCH54486.1 hypothetical protein DJ568_11725 [Mucilaginibacter hurinus]
MTLTELKKSIHEQIDSSNNKELLERVSEIIKGSENLFVIPEHMKKGIELGLQDIKAGKTNTLEEFEKKYQQWLKK